MRNKYKNITLKPDSLSEKNLHKLKWCTTIAIIGLPVLIQILGALMLYSSKYSSLMSMSVIALLSVAALCVVACGIYALRNRVFLRFSASSHGLQEWEAKTQNDAFAFSYQVILKGVLIVFIAISVLGGLQAFTLLGWANISFGSSIVLNIEAIAAIIVALTYLVLLMPTLYIAWTLTPLNESEAF